MLARGELNTIRASGLSGWTSPAGEWQLWCRFVRECFGEYLQNYCNVLFFVWCIICVNLRTNACTQFSGHRFDIRLTAWHREQVVTFWNQNCRLLNAEFLPGLMKRIISLLDHKPGIGNLFYWRARRLSWKIAAGHILDYAFRLLRLGTFCCTKIFRPTIMSINMTMMS